MQDYLRKRAPLLIPPSNYEFSPDDPQTYCPMRGSTKPRYARAVGKSNYTSQAVLPSSSSLLIKACE